MEYCYEKSILEKIINDSNEICLLVFNATFNNISVTGLLWQLGNHSIWRKSWIFCKLLTNFIRYNFTSHVYIFIEIDLMGEGLFQLPPTQQGRWFFNTWTTHRCEFDISLQILIDTNILQIHPVFQCAFLGCEKCLDRIAIISRFLDYLYII